MRPRETTGRLLINDRLDQEIAIGGLLAKNEERTGFVRSSFLFMPGTSVHSGDYRSLAARKKVAQASWQTASSTR